MSNSVRIVSDSACDLPQEFIEKHNISIVPMTIRFDDDEYVDGVELTNGEFWARMANSSVLPSTAAPSPGAFEEAFRKASQNGKFDVVCISISSKLSATCQAATTGARSVSDEIDVRVVDSKLCTIAQGLVCLEAARIAEAGGTIDSVVAGAEDLLSRMKLYGSLDTLDNLRKGGRIGAAGAFFGSLLSVKPMLTFKDGEVHAESRQRTRTKALTHLAKLVADAAPVDHVGISHSNASDVEEFLEMLSPIVDRNKVIVTSIGPVIGAHGGPGIIAVTFASQPSNH